MLQHKIVSQMQYTCRVASYSPPFASKGAFYVFRLSPETGSSNARRHRSEISHNYKTFYTVQPRFTESSITPHNAGPVATLPLPTISGIGFFFGGGGSKSTQALCSQARLYVCVYTHRHAKLKKSRSSLSTKASGCSTRASAPPQQHHLWSNWQFCLVQLLDQVDLNSQVHTLR